MFKQRIKKIIWKIASVTAFPCAAKIAWRDVKKRYKNTLVFLNFSAIGDTLYGMSFLHEIRKKDPSKKIVVAVFDKYRRIAESYGSCDEILLIPNKGFRWFCYKSLIANIGNAEKLWKDGIVVIPWGIMEKRKDDDSDFLSAIQYAFGLNPETAIQYHALQAAPVLSIPDFDLCCHKIVVLNPYSVSVKLSPNEFTFFEDACVLLKQMGYIPYTNVVSNQKPVKGSLPLRCSLEEFLGVARKIPFIVSLRSGILDFVMKTDVNMFVIYNRTWHYDWYRLEKWKCHGKYKEINIENNFDLQTLLNSLREYVGELKSE